MNIDITINLIKTLPECIMKKIIYYYIINYLKNNNQKKTILIINNIKKYIDFDYICIYFNKFHNNGYIPIDTKDITIIYSKFTQVQFNSLIDKKYLNTMINTVWKRIKFHYNKLKVLPGDIEQHNLFIAGGFFTNYNTDNVFIKQFPEYYQYFLISKDVDIFYTNNRNPERQYDNHYVSVKHYLSKFNLVLYYNNFESTIIDQFDYDCCLYLFLKFGYIKKILYDLILLFQINRQNFLLIQSITIICLSFTFI